MSRQPRCRLRDRDCATRGGAGRLVDAGRSLLVEADEQLFNDDFEDACRRYLLAALCFSLAAACTELDPDIRRGHHITYWYAWQAAQSLLPDAG